MDWVFREYSNPFSLLDSLIQNNRFNEWVDTFAETHNRKIQWEFWLHKDFENSWDDFIHGNEKETTQEECMSDEQIISIVQDSRAIINDYHIQIEGDE